MDMPKKSELVEAIIEAAVPCIKNFFTEHENEAFYGFAVELLAEEGYFHICANSVESFQPTIDSYTKTGESMDEILGEGIKWNNQEWAYFDFNADCEIWNEKWEPTSNKISAYKKYMWSLPDDEMMQLSQEFEDVFKSAGEEAFEKLMALHLLSNIKKTDDFRQFIFEHHDVF